MDPTQELTQEEIAALVAAGDLNRDNYGEFQLSANERGHAMKALMQNDVDTRMPPELQELAMFAVPVGGAAKLGLSLAGKAIPAIGGKIAGLGGAAIGSKLGHPIAGYQAGKGLFDTIKGMMGQGAAKAPSAAAGAVKGATKRRVPDVIKSKSAEDVAERVVDKGVKVEGATAGKPIQLRKSSMPVGSKANYAGWSAAQDAKYPNAPVEDLLTRLADALAKDRARIK